MCFYSKPPNNNNNSPDVKKFSIPYAKIGKFIKKLTGKSPYHSRHSSTTHIKNINIPKNKDVFTPPPPPTSYEIDTTCTNQVMTNKYISSEPYGLLAHYLDIHHHPNCHQIHPIPQHLQLPQHPSSHNTRLENNTRHNATERQETNTPEI